jgi:dCTP diphosphatase
MKNDWKSLRDEVVKFRDARDWKQFHTPKNLVAGLAIEAAELQEQFLWCTDAECEARIHDKARRKAIAEELADVVNYALLLADRMDLDLPAEIRKKIRINARKYPVSKSKGSAKKYTEL